MSATEREVTLATLSDQLDELANLFKRRLLNDRAKQGVIDGLQARLELSERVHAAESLRPLVTRIALVIERVQSAESIEGTCDSIVEELEDVLGTLGVTPIPSSGMVDSRRHEIVSVSGEGPVLWIGELVRAGYEKDGVVLRPAKVAAIRMASDAAPAGLDSRGEADLDVGVDE